MSYCVYNLGTGQGTSVLQLLLAFEEVNNIKIPYEMVDRRPGDLATVFADVGRAEQELGWKARRGIREMCLDSWRFENGTD